MNYYYVNLHSSPAASLDDEDLILLLRYKPTPTTNRTTKATFIIFLDLLSCAASALSIILAAFPAAPSDFPATAALLSSAAFLSSEAAPTPSLFFHCCRDDEFGLCYVESARFEFGTDPDLPKAQFGPMLLLEPSIGSYFRENLNLVLEIGRADTTVGSCFREKLGLDSDNIPVYLSTSS
nr:hypothetical protein Iba_chr07bCG9560 [Ipomoea batatas]